MKFQLSKYEMWNITFEISQLQKQNFNFLVLSLYYCDTLTFATKTFQP